MWRFHRSSPNKRYNTHCLQNGIHIACAPFAYESSRWFWESRRVWQVFLYLDFMYCWTGWFWRSRIGKRRILFNTLQVCIVFGQPDTKREFIDSLLTVFKVFLQRCCWNLVPQTTQLQQTDLEHKRCRTRLSSSYLDGI